MCLACDHLKTFIMAYRVMSQTLYNIYEEDQVITPLTTNINRPSTYVGVLLYPVIIHMCYFFTVLK